MKEFIFMQKKVSFFIQINIKFCFRKSILRLSQEQLKLKKAPKLKLTSKIQRITKVFNVYYQMEKKYGLPKFK